jgi:myo-inositol-1(or 4)-monophosphatase
MTDSLATELAFAKELAERAGDLLLARFGRPQSIQHKGPRDVVTEADAASERFITTAIRSMWPGDAVLAEESGALVGPAGGRRLWIVDPLDGTINYANGIPVFSVSIALAIDGRPQVGVVRDPILAETFSATAGGPATLNGRPIRASSKALLIDCVVSVSLQGRGFRVRTPQVNRAVRANFQFGSAALELAWVAAGRLDAFAVTGGLSIWDIAAGGLIAQRAGARVGTADGEGGWFQLQPTRLAQGILAAGASTFRMFQNPDLGLGSGRR